jgi:hypothetical protein
MNVFVFGRMIERPPANKGNQPIMSDRTSLCAAMLELLVERYVPSARSRSSRLPHWLFLRRSVERRSANTGQSQMMERHSLRPC